LQVLFQGAQLGEGHALHAEIVACGDGRFSHWGDTLLFSLPANPAPETKDRIELVYPVHLRAELATGLGLGWMLSLWWRHPELIRASFARVRNLVDSRAAIGTWWACAGGLLVVAIALRWAWTTGLGVPYVTPDSASHMHAADSALALP
jgi:hypothetical protein